MVPRPTHLRDTSPTPYRSNFATDNPVDDSWSSSVDQRSSAADALLNNFTQSVSQIGLGFFISLCRSYSVWVSPLAVWREKNVNRTCFCYA